ncbi:MAG TPA: hypothetical protein VJ840_15595 [Gemmatimonadaceae bacterium]|nr:hypothetical protein [Gemmatimonadaceae bacterium]
MPFRLPSTRVSNVGLVAPLILLGACVAEPVEWGNVAYRHSQLGDPDARSAIMSAGLPAIPGTVVPCIMSIRAAGDSGELFRAWWAVRPDSSVALSMQRSENRGTTWDNPIEVESRDSGRRACQRPAPGITYDARSGYVYLVYFVEASDGAGVFFAHSMDKGGMFHSPVPVVYGKTPSVASVAARGDSVVVVFEDPNSTTPRIGIVLSHTTGHVFDQRGQVTPDNVAAVSPWVALNHKRITVWWKTPVLDNRSIDEVGYREGVWR